MDSSGCAAEGLTTTVENHPDEIIDPVQSDQNNISCETQDIPTRKRIIVLEEDDNTVEEQFQADIIRNEKPKPKSKKQSTKLLKEMQARQLLESAIIIPVAVTSAELKRQKRRERRSEESETESDASVNKQRVNMIREEEDDTEGAEERNSDKCDDNAGEEDQTENVPESLEIEYVDSKGSNENLLLSLEPEEAINEMLMYQGQRSSDSINKRSDRNSGQK